jgi:hypothetical protein
MTGSCTVATSGDKNGSTSEALVRQIKKELTSSVQRIQISSATCKQSSWKSSIPNRPLWSPERENLCPYSQNRKKPKSLNAKTLEGSCNFHKTIPGAENFLGDSLYSCIDAASGDKYGSNSESYLSKIQKRIDNVCTSDRQPQNSSIPK